jgi:hypothetical protein
MHSTERVFCVILLICHPVSAAAALLMIIWHAGSNLVLIAGFNR